MTESAGPIRLAASQEARAAQVLDRAFLVDPAYSILFPDEVERERALQRLFGTVIG